MNSELINKIKTDGIIRLENFLSKEELSDLKKIVKFYSAPKSSKNSYWPTNNKLLLYKILKLDFVKFKFSLKILNFEKNKKLKDIADKFYGSKSYLRFIDAYYSPVSNKNIIDWHTDQAYHGDKNPEKYVNPDHYFLKIFIYLTDVNPLNGCMSYIPGSHKIGYAIRKGIFEKKISYRPYWHLKDFRKLIMSEENKEYFQNYFKNQKYLLEKFLDITNNLTNQSSSHNFDYTLKAGSAIIFDEGGVHKGSKTLQQDRMVLRYIYSNFK
tara:strand:+ start:172 stop:975 length:804 start_codon:yes stop_codon:yes gene_type:complete